MERVCITLFIFAMFLNQSAAEIFSSMAAMENLASWEGTLRNELTKYVKETDKKLSDIRRFVEGVGKIVGNDPNDVGEYLANPMNGLRMLKRFKIHWKRMEGVVKIKPGSEAETKKILKYLGPYSPVTADVEGAMEAIFRLQETYNLTSSSLAQGIIKDIHHANYSLGVRDILRFGKHAYEQGKWMLAVQWLETALDHLNKLPPGEEKIREKSEALDYLAFALERSGNAKKAYKIMLDLAELLPEEGRIKENINYFQEVLQKPEDDQPIDKEQSMSKEEKTFYLGMKRYESLCRGEGRNFTKKEERKLKCWYRRTNPVLRLKPQKVERVWVSPEILLFYDLTTDKESAFIKNTAYPQLRRATIFDPKTGQLTHAKYRVSKSAWLSHEDYPIIKNLRTRTKAATGLEFKYAEDLQVNNYGLAGQYEPHVDHSREGEPAYANLRKNNMGNRIATLLFYLNDVTAGGATVFTEAGAVISPVRNAAAFWYNLKRNGRGNEKTKHAACPVLVGHKWVSNWWISEFGQEFRRRCNLNPKW